MEGLVDGLGSGGGSVISETQPKGARLGRSGQSRHHDDHPHRGQNGAALKRAAGLIGADPEDVDADKNADRR